MPLTSSYQCVTPRAAHFVKEARQAPHVTGHCMIVEIPLNHPLQPSTDTDTGSWRRRISVARMAASVTRILSVATVLTLAMLTRIGCSIGLVPAKHSQPPLVRSLIRRISQ